MSKFTFKRQPKATGLARIGNPHSNVDIRNGGKYCGHISAPNYRDSHVWAVWFMVKTADHPGWKNSRLRKKFESEEEARNWIQDNRTSIIMNLDLHYQDD